MSIDWASLTLADYIDDKDGCRTKAHRSLSPDARVALELGLVTKAVLGNVPTSLTAEFGAAAAGIKAVLA